MNKKVLAIILLILISLSAILVYYFYPELLISYFKLKGGEEEQCSMARTYFNSLSRIVGRDITLDSDLENSLSNFCDFTKTHVIKDKSMYNVSSCDYDKIKEGIENPNSLNIDDIRTYSYLSVPNSIKFEVDYFNEDLIKDCNSEKAFASIIFNIIFTSSHSTLYLSQTGLTEMCLDNNFTDIEKKDCLITLLNAEKSAIDYYSKEKTDINLTACRQSTFDLFKGQMERSGGMLVNFHPMLSHRFIDSVCVWINHYKKDLQDNTINSNLNDLEKYKILSNLFIQNSYFGQKDVNKRYYHILLDNMSNIKYKNLSQEYLQKYGFI